MPLKYSSVILNFSRENQPQQLLDERFFVGKYETQIILKGTVMQIEKALINDHLCVSKVS